MNSLKQYLEVQRKENEFVKNEIIAKIEELLHPLELPTVTTTHTKYSNHISELCHFEQKVNHKLTEINFELKKFQIQNEYPKYCPPSINNNSHDCLDDIETLKANSSRLILKLDKLRDEECNFNSSSQSNNASCPHFQDIDKVSMFTKSMKDDEFLEKLDVDTTSYSKNDVLGNENEENENDRNIQDQNSSESSVSESDFLLKKELDEDEVVLAYNFTKKQGREEILTKSVESFSDKYSKLEEMVNKLDERVETCFKDIEPKISEAMWKNVSEWESKVLEDIEDSCCNTNKDFSPETEVKTNRVTENLYNCCKTASDEKSQSTFDSVKNIDFDSGSDSLKESDSSQVKDDTIPLRSNKVMLESHRGESFEEDKEVESTFGGLENEEFKTEDSELGLSKNKLEDSLVSNEEPTQSKKVKDSEDESQDTYPLEIAEPKPIFSADEKIKKLGLEDRWTLFEKTKKAAVLPDLRLKPSELSVSDTEKLKRKYIKEEKFEIADSIVPKVNMVCVFSHVESPSEFYIHPNTEEAKLIDSLNDLITEQYSSTKTPYSSKYEAFEDIKRFCCAYVKNDKSYYRAEVVNWLFDKTDKLVYVQLVDYGNYTLVHYKNLRQLTEQISSLPRIAIKCHLPLLYPPGSTKNNLLTEWPKDSTNAFFELSGLTEQNNPTFFQIVHVEKKGNTVGVDMQQVKGRDLNTVGQLLIDLGHAVQIILPEDDPMGILSDEEDIKNLELCDNINEVILGYDPKDEARICKFTKSNGGRCFKRNCKLEHAKFSRGGFTTDTTLTYAEALSDMRLPKQGDIIGIRFTTFLEPTRFYVNLMRHVEDLRHLEIIMNDNINSSKFERYKILPAHGEIVIVKHWAQRWLRAKIRHLLFNENGDCIKAQVFTVDYGYTTDVLFDNVRKIKKEYLNLPFQALECVLHHYKESKQFSRDDMDKFFYENMVYRSFSAEVVGVSDMLLCLDIYYRDSNLGDILSEFGFLEKEEHKMIFPHVDSKIIPG